MTAAVVLEGNPLLAGWNRCQQNGRLSYEAWSTRRNLTHLYSFAIPDERALDIIARYAPILELGAGTGYWAALLRRKGVDILAYDEAPPDIRSRKNHYFQSGGTWTTVQRGNDAVVKAHSSRTLMLCWPCYGEPWAYRALTDYAGKTVIYIGEPAGGCTADDAFFDALENDWRRIVKYNIPQWEGPHDRLEVWTRKGHKKKGARDGRG